MGMFNLVTAPKVTKCSRGRIVMRLTANGSKIKITQRFYHSRCLVFPVSPVSNSDLKYKLQDRSPES